MRRLWGFEDGTIAPLIAGYLALILFTLIGSAAIGVTLIASNRIQAVADAAVLYAHDRAVTRGIPDPEALADGVGEFLAIAPSARRISVSLVETQVVASKSFLTLCGSLKNPLFPLPDSEICRQARAESFLIP